MVQDPYAKSDVGHNSAKTKNRFQHNVAQLRPLKISYNMTFIYTLFQVGLFTKFTFGIHVNPGKDHELHLQ